MMTFMMSMMRMKSSCIFKKAFINRLVDVIMKNNKEICSSATGQFVMKCRMYGLEEEIEKKKTMNKTSGRRRGTWETCLS